MTNPVDRACAKHYTETVLNPFDTPAGACVPVLPCLDSAKRKIFARGTALVQSNGFGGICANTCMANDLPCVYYTTGAGTGESIINTTIVNGTNNSELSAVDFSDSGVQGRVVGAGLRIRFTGKEIDMNGTVYALEEPSHLETLNMTVKDLLEYDKVKTVPFNREWTVVTWQPVLPPETAYSTNAWASPFPAPDKNQPLILLIQCQAGSGPDGTLPFEWEWYLHYEAIGSQARGKTTSHVAPFVGTQAMAALQKAPSRLFDDVSNHKISIRKLSDHMVDTGSTWSMGDTMSRVARTAVGAITSRAASQYMMGGLSAIAL